MGQKLLYEYLPPPPNYRPSLTVYGVLIMFVNIQAPTDVTVSTEEPYRPPDTKSDNITTVNPTDPTLATQRSTNDAVTKTIAPTKGLTTQDATERAVTTKNQTDDAVLRKASTKDITTEDPTDTVVGTKNGTYDPVITKASTDGRTTENPTQPVVASKKLTEDAVVTKAQTDDPTYVVASKQGPINNGVLTKVSIDETSKKPTTTGDSAVADGGGLFVPINILLHLAESVLIISELAIHN